MLRGFPYRPREFSTSVSLCISCRWCQKRLDVQFNQGISLIQAILPKNRQYITTSLNPVFLDAFQQIRYMCTQAIWCLPYRASAYEALCVVPSVAIFAPRVRLYTLKYTLSIHGVHMCNGADVTSLTPTLVTPVPWFCCGS